MMADEEVVPKRQIGNWDFGCVILLLMGFILLVLFPRPHREREASRRSSCQNNLKQMGLVFKMYADEHKGYFPTQQQVGCNGEDIVWSKTPDMKDVISEYLSDPKVMLCPSYTRKYDYNRDKEEWGKIVSPDYKTSEFTDNAIIESCELLENSYTYYGYHFLMRHESKGVTTQATESFRVDFEQFLSSNEVSTDVVFEGSWKLNPESDIFPGTTMDKYLNSQGFQVQGKGWSNEEGLQRVAKRKEAIQHYTFQGNAFPGEIPRLRKGIERFFITDIGNPAGAMSAQVNIVVIHDRIPKDLELAHLPGGVNVLFMDGHVEFVKNNEAGQFVFGPVGEIVQRRW